jgi:hypothetical protein
MPPGIPLRSADSLGPTALVLIGALIAAPRFGLISLGIQFSGDSHTFALVAENILEHFCVSMSDPADGDCAPHWGGNQSAGSGRGKSASRDDWLKLSYRLKRHG